MNTSRLSLLALLAFTTIGTSTAYAGAGKKSEIDLKSAIVAYTDNATFRASVFAIDGTNKTPVVDGDVEFTVDGHVWGTSKTDASGVATLTKRPTFIPGTPVKTSARFVGKGDVLPSVDNSTLGVVKGMPYWVAARAADGASDVRIDGAIMTKNFGPGLNTKVTVSVNGKDVKTVDQWSGVNLPFSTFAQGQNKIHLQFEGNELFAPASADVVFFKKRDTNLYFDPNQPPRGANSKFRVRVGQGVGDSPTAPMFVPAAGVTVKLYEDHPYFKTIAIVDYKRIEHTAVTDAGGWATFTTSNGPEWKAVMMREAALRGRAYDHKLTIAVDDAQWRVAPKSAHVRAINVTQ